MSGSPTQRSLAKLREEGYLAEVVERWIPGANIRRDLFTVIDIVALRGAETLAVQACNYTDISRRAAKIADSPHTPAIRDAGWRIEIHGWHLVGRRYQVRVVDCS